MDNLKKVGVILTTIVASITVFTFLSGITSLNLFASAPTDSNTVSTPLDISTSIAEVHPTSYETVSEVSASYLFSDNFDLGLKPEWVALNGKWTMINGRLQATDGDFALIRIGDGSWNDFTLQSEIGDLDRPNWETNTIRFGIRQDQEGKSGYLFEVTAFAATCTLQVDGQISIEFHVQERRYFSHSIRIEAQDNVFRFYIDNELICSFVDSMYDQGYVFIAASSGNSPYGKFPWVDSFSLSD